MVVNDASMQANGQLPPLVNGQAPIALSIEQVPALDGLQAPLVDDHVFLVGRPSLRGYISFVTDLAVDGPSADPHKLTADWRAAQAEVQVREKNEAGIADNAPILPLPESVHGLRDELQRDPLYHHAFDLLPSEVAIVELDKLVVYQKHINLAFTRRLRERLGAQPDEASVFRTCLPFDHPRPQARWMKVHSNEYLFLSPSNDIRFLGPMMLEPHQITGVAPRGALIGVVGLAVGFGSNFLNVIHAENRLVLNNGSHRAFALRELGFTHAPCIVQHVGSREELRAVASSDLRRNPDLYLRHPRPSMMRDYFDPALHRVIPCVRRLRQVKVRFSVDETDIPAM